MEETKRQTETKRLTDSQREDLAKLMTLPEDSRNMLIMFAAGLVAGSELSEKQPA